MILNELYGLAMADNNNDSDEIIFKAPAPEVSDNTQIDIDGDSHDDVSYQSSDNEIEDEETDIEDDVEDDEDDDNKDDNEDKLS